MDLKKQGTIFNVVIIATLIFDSVAFLNDDINIILLYFLLPACFVISFFLEKRIFTNNYQKLLFILYIWIAFTYFFAFNKQLANHELHKILGCVIVVYIVSHLCTDENNFKWLYLIYVLFLVTYYMYSRNDIIQTDIFADERIGSGKVNANDFAYHTFDATFSLFMLGEMTNNTKTKKVYNILFLCMIPFSFYIAFITASRQVLLIQIPLLAFLLYHRYINGKRISTHIVVVLICCIVTIYAIPELTYTYNNSFLKTRSEKNVTEDIRAELILEATMVGLAHPVVGVGPGNFIAYNKSRRFSHCSYTELFANCGLPALIIYLILLFTLVRNQWKYYRLTRDKNHLFFLIFGILFIIEQFFYVFYTTQWLLAFFIIVAMHGETYYIKNKYKYQVTDI